MPTSSVVPVADEALVALDHAALLPALGGAGPRRVWVAGGGDEAFAARLAEACPGVAMVEEPAERIDLAVNLGAFGTMTESEVDGHVQHAYDVGCPYLYSFDPRHEVDDVACARVGAIIARRYWPHEIPVVGLGVPEAPRRTRLPQARPGRAAPGRPLAYRHLVGWRRRWP